MKPWIVATALTLSTFALGQDTKLGTKPDLALSKPVASTAPSIGGLEVVQLVVALVVVFCLVKYVLPKLVAKFGRKLTSPATSSIRIEESAHFGGGNLQVVSVRGKTILLAVTQSGVSFLTDLTDTQPQPDQPAFFELLDQAKEEEIEPVVTEEPVVKAVIETPEPKVVPNANKAQKAAKAYGSKPESKPVDELDADDLQARLKRLSKLVG